MVARNVLEGSFSSRLLTLVSQFLKPTRCGSTYKCMTWRYCKHAQLCTCWYCMHISKLKQQCTEYSEFPYSTYSVFSVLRMCVCVCEYAHVYVWMNEWMSKRERGWLRRVCVCECVSVFIYAVLPCVWPCAYCLLSSPGGTTWSLSHHVLIWWEAGVPPFSLSFTFSLSLSICHFVMRSTWVRWSWYCHLCATTSYSLVRQHLEEISWERRTLLRLTPVWVSLDLRCPSPWGRWAS